MHVHVLLFKKTRKLFSKVSPISEAQRTRKKFMANLAVNPTELPIHVIKGAEHTRT